jgi:C_GCAxxG_C_C family probable redox protein
MEEPAMKPQTEHFSKKAVDYFNQGYNCAQSVLLTMQEYYGIQENKLIPKIATAFGGGIGRLGSLCGALTGAIIAIGLKYGTNEIILKKKEKTYKLAQKFYEQFAKASGSLFCKELIGYDLTDPEELDKARKSNVHKEKCTHFVKEAVEILINLEV